MAELEKQIGANRIGIYANNWSWNDVVGGWTGLSKYPLWYAHYDGKPDFTDFKKFGGFTKPSMKQYQGDQKICNTNVDYNTQ